MDRIELTAEENAIDLAASLAACEGHRGVDLYVHRTLLRIALFHKQRAEESFKRELRHALMCAELNQELEQAKALGATPFCQTLQILSERHDELTDSNGREVLEADPFGELEYCEKHGIPAHKHALVVVENRLGATFPDLREIAYHAVLAYTYQRLEDAKILASDSADASEADSDTEDNPESCDM